MTSYKKGVIAWLVMPVIVAAVVVLDQRNHAGASSVQNGDVGSRTPQAAETARVGIANETRSLSRDSDLDTIRRLRNIQGAESATVDYWSRKLMEGTTESINRSRAEDTAIIDSIGAHQAKLDLATRDLNRFMR